MNKTTVLVTGGAGYIGSHICKELYKQGFYPITVDDLSMGRKEFVKWGPLETLNLTDFSSLNEVFKKYQPAAVMHFAGVSSVTESIENPAKYYENNVVATYQLLKACVENRVSSLIFSSTCAVFGIPYRMPIRENDPQNPISTYGKSKKMIEQMLQDFDIAYGLKSVSLRYFNAAGADPEGDIGEYHDPETHIIPLTIQAAISNHQPLTVYGSDFNTKDGSAIRDFIHVRDLAIAHILSLHWLLSSRKSDVFHLGSGIGTSVFEIIENVEAITKKKVPFRVIAKREGEPETLIADITKAKTILGWTPSHSHIKEMIHDAYKWTSGALCDLIT
jgi:UDP-arabinose 4-epimerase